jgi:hypothetical protein
MSRIAIFLVMLTAAGSAHSEPTRYNSLTMSDGYRYELQSNPETDEQKLAFAQLTNDERETFFTRRNRTLTKIAKTLHKAPVKVGFIVRTGNKFTRVSKSAWAYFTQRPTDITTPAVPTSEPPSTYELGVETIQATLSDFDSGLWDSLRIFAKPSAQKGGIATVGANIGIGAMKDGFFIGYQFGVGWGYDKVRRQKYIEYFYIRDRFRSAATFVLNAAINGRGGYRAGPANEGPNLQKIDRKGFSMLTPLGVLNLGNDTYTAMSGPTVDLGWAVVGPLKTAQLAMTDWHENGRRLYYDSVRNLGSQLIDLFNGRKNEITIDLETSVFRGKTCESLFTAGQPSP